MNLGGLFAAIGRAFPGYVQGKRQAIEDNWKDLQNFNQVQQGQIANAYDELTFNDAVANAHMLADTNRMGYTRSAIDTLEKIRHLPYELASIEAENQFGIRGDPNRPGLPGGIVRTAKQKYDMSGTPVGVGAGQMDPRLTAQAASTVYSNDQQNGQVAPIVTGSTPGRR